MKWARKTLARYRGVRGMAAGYLMLETISRKLGPDERFGTEHLV
jgi:hypothetical protein